MTAQTLEQENATEVSGDHSYDIIDGDVTVTGGRFQGTTFKGNVTINGGYFLLAKFEGTVTINNDSENIQRCTFDKDVTIQKIKNDSSTAGNTFKGKVTAKSGLSFREDSFLGGVNGDNLKFTSCTFGDSSTVSSSTFTHCVFAGDLPQTVDSSSWSRIKVGDGLESSTLKFASASYDVTPAVSTAGAYYQDTVYVFGDIGNVTNIDENAFSNELTVDGKYSARTGSSYDGRYLQINSLNSSVNEITLKHVETPLVLDDDGYPEGSNGGTKSVTAGTWTFTVGEDGSKTLTLKSGEFDLTRKSTSCNLVIEKNATLKGLTCAGSITNNGGTIASGIFLKQPAGVDGLFPIKMDSEDYEANGLKLSADKTIYVKFDGVTEQSLAIKSTTGQTPTAWYADFVLGSGYLRDGYSVDPTFSSKLQMIGISSANVIFGALTIKAKNISYVPSASMRAEYRPYADGNKIGVTVGGEKISSDGKTELTYSPDKDFTKVAITSNNLQYSLSVAYRKGTATYQDINTDEIGKPGDYKITISTKDDRYVPDDLIYTFTINKATPTEELFKQYCDVQLPGGESGEIAYDGNAHAVTVAKKSDAPDDIEFDDAVYYCKDGTDSWTTTAPIEPGTYKVAVSAKPTAFYNACQIEVGEFTITKAKLTDEQKKDLYLQYDEDDRLASIDPDFDVSSFTGTDTYFYKDTDGKEYTPDELLTAPAGEYTKYRIFTSTMYEDVTVDFAEYKYVLAPAVGNFIYTEPTDLTTDNAAAKLAEMETALTENSYIAAKDVTVTYYQVITGEDGQETETPVAGVPTEEGDYIFKISVAASSEIIGGADVGTPKYTPANDLTDPSWKFTIGKAEEPAPIIPGDDADGAGTVVAAVIGTAAVGGAAYLVGTQVWLETNLPKGAAIPTNRQQLADLLWTAAGKPEPKSNVLFADIAAAAADSQKAARWCVEQGLLKDTGESFKPGDYTFRPQVIKAWNDLQAQLKADK